LVNGAKAFLALTVISLVEVVGLVSLQRCNRPGLQLKGKKARIQTRSRRKRRNKKGEETENNAGSTSELISEVLMKLSRRRCSRPPCGVELIRNLSIFFEKEFNDQVISVLSSVAIISDFDGISMVYIVFDPLLGSAVVSTCLSVSLAKSNLLG